MESIIGSPGTGKTYALERKIKESGEEKYIYLTYNRSMASLARERIVNDNRRIGTFHSILSRTFGLVAGKEGDFLSPDDESDFCAKMGIQYAVQKDEEGHWTGMSDWERFREWNDYIENAMVKPFQPVKEKLSMLSLYDAYRAYKERVGKKDYTDILKMGTESELPYVNSLYIDEAQDLTVLMWKLVDRWPAGRKVIALDDEQSLYSYKGVSENQTLSHVRNPEILKTCRRYGIAVKDVAERIILPARTIERNYEAIGNSVVGHSGLRNFVDLPGTRAILCRTNYLAREIAKILSMPARPINPQHSLGIGWTPITFELHNIFSHYPKLEKEEWETVIQRTPAAIWQRGTKRNAKLGKLSLEYYEQMQVGSAEKLISLLNVSDRQKQNILRYKGMEINPVLIDTMHSAKGLEFDHVMLASDRPITMEFNAEERRVLYVGATRAKQSLDFHHFNVYADSYEMWRYFQNP